MKIVIYLSLTFSLFFLFSCTKQMGETSLSGGESTTTIVPNGGDSGTTQAGVITAGEWNDLDHWSFWDSLLQKDPYSQMPNYWLFYHKHRFSVKLIGIDSLPIVEASVQLKQNGTTIFKAKTDNYGTCEVWADLFQANAPIDLTSLQLDINNGSKIVNSPTMYEQGVNKIILPTINSTLNKIDVAFVVDATGSMGDELEYLKVELNDVINRIQTDNATASLNTAAVFYRDEGDEYLTRLSPFTNNISQTISFIKNQRAAGGGDFPEAVHTALDKSVGELQWSSTAKTRIIFLLLDAPPHYTTSVIDSIHNSIRSASEKGIKVIPITASGINKETEFLMRFMAISTNGTYVFITNHSGIGNNHLEATVGPYQVEYLNNLMVRLVNKYAN